jgi:hypothetical protein
MKTRTGLKCYMDSVAWCQEADLARNRESLAALARLPGSPLGRTLIGPVQTTPALDPLPALLLHSRSRS